MPGKLSLTKHYVFSRLVDEIASLQPGDTVEEVQRALLSPHPELADDIFRYDDRHRLLDSELLKACKRRDAEVLRVLWVSLVAADSRLQRLLGFMSKPNGKLDESLYSTSEIKRLLTDEVGVQGHKPATNVARYLAQARIFVPKLHRTTIVGAAWAPHTEDAVPLCFAHLTGFLSWNDPLNDAVGFGVHSWLNLDVSRFKALASGAAATASPAPVGNPPPMVAASSKPDLHRDYVDQDEQAGIAAPATRQTDPDAVEKATREHRRTQNALANWARRRGFGPVEPAGDPLFDVGWWMPKSPVFFVAEVKSLGADNETRQLRLGLGQILDYRKQLRDLQDDPDDVIAVLAVSRKPVSSHWVELADELDILLSWPPFGALDEWVRTHRGC